MKQCFKFLEATKHFYKNPKNIYKKILKSLEATEPFYKKKIKLKDFLKSLEVTKPFYAIPKKM